MPEGIKEEMPHLHQGQRHQVQVEVQTHTDSVLLGNLLLRPISQEQQPRRAARIRQLGTGSGGLKSWTADGSKCSPERWLSKLGHLESIFPAQL